MNTRFALVTLIAAGSLGVLAPVSFTRAAGVAPVTAECATCCPQNGATCVVCGSDKCVAHTNYYDGKVGPNGCEAGEAH